MQIRRLLRLFLPQALIGVGVGIAFRLSLDPVSPRDAALFLQSGFHGALIGIGISLVNLIYVRWVAPLLRRTPLVVEDLSWSLAMLFGITVAFLSATWAMYGIQPTMALAPALPMILGITFAISIAIALLTRVTRLIGGRVLINLMLGSYQRPRIERRIVLFLDLAGSTTLAERFGEAAIQRLIARFFVDIDTAFVDTGGEVLSYAGDGVIVTWRESGKARNGRAMEALIAADDAIFGLAASYEKEFGVTPGFRAGLHSGDVSVGEIGGQRRQISLFGDTMNVAARLQEAAKSVPGGWVASAAYLGRASLPGGLIARDLGSLELRGRNEAVRAYALERA